MLLDHGALHPSVVRWGAELGGVTAQDALAVTLAIVRPHASNSPDEPVRAALLPEQRTGWLGRPARAAAGTGGLAV
ncbi:hypothetical protein GCM10027406_30760 [Leifsonia lichenia]